MVIKLKQVLEDESCHEEYFLPGNACCAGCGLEIALRWAMKALGPNTALVTPACCLNVVIGLYPKTAPTFPFINMAFAAGAADTDGTASIAISTSMPSNPNLLVILSSIFYHSSCLFLVICLLYQSSHIAAPSTLY